MQENNNSVIKERIEQLKASNYLPEELEEHFSKLEQEHKNNIELQQLLEESRQIWNKELLESYLCVEKLQHTLNQYENDLVLMMDQMDALVKCSLLIKQYSLYLKEEIDKVADKIDKQGFDERLDQLVSLLDEIKPKKHLNLVRNADVLEFPKKD
jgi:Cft2 family RNA processing exonuclease